MEMKQALQRVVNRAHLTRHEMSEIMRLMMTGEATSAQIAGMLIALRMKGETVEEITGAAMVMRELATPVVVSTTDLVDIVGTGGDEMNTFNVSTTSALVAAAAGAKVAKHGNRSVSSRSGSADVLEALGVKLSLSPAQVAACVETVGIGFMFAPQHHSAMKYAMPARKEMGVRTLFNLLGPLTNPAGATHQLLGVFSATWLSAMAEVLRELGSVHVLVVHSDEGLDEISICSDTKVAELSQGTVRNYCITPEDFGLKRAQLSEIQVNSVEESVAMVHQVLANTDGAARDIVLLNAGAAIYAADLADSLAQGIDLARNTLASGAAKATLDRLVNFTQTI
ncbi:anthranilate phosphoribosyltransferase [Thioflexithrix psekupsensis]|uniref:Anthranilate phosphoribosyltransferase n=1 Tax=Thioflexithrix psekupsensis TaxID=1570016 RepID=A0A251X4W4_9GAMM|nr:anthranilate phosphoribosyltransferase [Thioflexithrix psekupsensis]OUD12395.1 anthranilate phosphoribosyltransferase [Thioflexithrix psekupsensis]